MKRVLNISCKMHKVSPSSIMEMTVSRFLGTGVRSRAVSRRKRFVCWWYTCAHRKLKSLMPRPRETSNALLVEIRVESHHFDTHTWYVLKGQKLSTEISIGRSSPYLSSFPQWLGRLNIKQTIKDIGFESNNQTIFIRPWKKDKIKFEELSVLKKIHKPWVSP